MSYDRSWRIRKQFACFINVFLQPLDSYKERLELKCQGESYAELGPQAKSVVMSEQAKQTKKAFKSTLFDITLEVLNDSDDQVAIEGIKVFNNFYFLFNKADFEDIYLPRVEEILRNAIENRISVSQQACLSHLQGPILHRLDDLKLLKDHMIELLFHFLCICLKEPVGFLAGNSSPTEQSSDDIGITIKEYYHNKQMDSQNILLSAVYNLPCFYKILGHRVQPKPAPSLALSGFNEPEHAKKQDEPCLS